MVNLVQSRVHNTVYILLLLLLSSSDLASYGKVLIGFCIITS